MTRRPAPEAARALVAERFPEAVQAWLAGSTTTGRATETSDLDITVLRDEGEVYRASVEYAGWPVELFVNTAVSVEHFVAKDLQRRRPTMARLVGTGVPLLGDSAGADVRHLCAKALERGPGPVAPDELELMRYGLTDELDDLAGVGPGPEAAAVAIGVWRSTAELALALAETWSGTGKWLVREVQALDERDGTHLATALDTALRRALAGERGSLVSVADEVLERCGGRHWAGLHRVANLP
jgi:hypothetical protein